VGTASGLKLQNPVVVYMLVPIPIPNPIPNPIPVTLMVEVKGHVAGASNDRFWPKAAIENRSI